MNRYSKTLVILTPGFAASEADSTCLPMQQALVRTVKENYPELNIVILSFQYPFFKRTYQWYGTTVISFGGKNRRGFSKRLLRPKIYSALKEIQRTNNIIGLLSFWYGECAWVGKRFADKNDLRHYCWLLGQDAKKGNKYVKDIRLKAGELIALSDFLQDEFERNYGIRPEHVIPPGVSTICSDVPIKEKDIDIIAAGSLIPLKQYEILLEVIAAIKKERPGVSAVLMGDGPERERLQSIISSKELEQNIILTGELPHPEVLQWMQRGRIFLHPSSYEGFGVVCLEALQAGCRVISFCRPMKQETEQWDIVQDKEEMIQKIISLLQDKENGYKSVAPFLMDDIAKKMIELFYDGYY